ncbi:MAG: FG-GAP repeat protein [Planctomycetota bacterium]|jgi:hypothetical protein
MSERNNTGLFITIAVILLVGVLPMYSAYASWPELDKLLASDGAIGDDFGGSVSISGDYAIVGAPGDDDNGDGSGSAYIFKRDGTSWSEQDKLLASDGTAVDNFGYSVSISGNYAIIGAAWDDGGGSAYIFYYNGTSWSEQDKLINPSGVHLDYFGYSVSISGDYAIVGAYGFEIMSSENIGSAYIFKRDGTNWSEQAMLLGYEHLDENFGYSVSISGDYAIVGAPGDDQAFTFKRDGTGWIQQPHITASDGVAHSNFGYSVSISGDCAIVAAGGSAYIFKRCGTSWCEQDKLTASDAAAESSFGESVSISGGYAIVGDTHDDDNGTDSGSAYMYCSYAIEGTKWHDIDGDGRFVEDIDEQEQGLPGWLIYIDENDNGQFDAGEPNDITDANGKYVLITPGPGTYLVAEVNKPCWEQTYPGGDGTYSVTLVMGESATGYNFGNAKPTDIHPSAFHQDQQDKLLASDGAADDWFGDSVCINGDYAIVGARGDDDNGSESGSAYIFALEDTDCNDWDEAAKLTAAIGDADDRFGVSVSISGNYAIVGADHDDHSASNSGAAYIFFYNGINWSEQAKLSAVDGTTNDYFGKSVSISGDYAIIGAYGDESAYIFKRNGINWSGQAKLTASDGAAGNRFGFSVSISGNYAIVGAYYDDDNGTNSGSAYIFKRNGASWSEQDKLYNADAAAYDYFGYSVSISGDYAIIGAYGDDDNGNRSGSAYIFKRNGTSWNEQAKLTAADGAADDNFSRSVSVSGNYAIVGSVLDDDNGTSSGSAYIFERDGTSWSEQAKLTATDAAAGDYFGTSVSISGAHAIVGAYTDDDNGSGSGSAYMFGKVLCPITDHTGDCFVDFLDLAFFCNEWLQGIQ